MAINELIHIPEVIEIIPAGRMPQFREDLATMNKFYGDLQPIFDEASKLQAMPVWSKANRTRAGELVTEYKRICKDAEATIDRYKDIVNRFKEEYILGPERRVADRATEIKNILTPKMGEWDRREAEEAAAERKRIADAKQAELNRQAELKRQADEEEAKKLRQERVAQIRADLKAKKITKRQAEKLLREAGALEEAAKAKAAADQEDALAQAKTVADSVKVESQVPNVKGNVKRVNYSAECTNRVGFIEAFAKTKPNSEAWTRLLAMVEVSDQLLSGEARARIKTSPEDTKHDLTIAEFEKLYPFVKVKENRSY
jgi:hypothetical protein